MSGDAQKAADSNQLSEFEGDAPVKAVLQLGGGDVGGFCDTLSVGTGLADGEANSSADAGCGTENVHIDRLHIGSGMHKPLTKLLTSKSASFTSRLALMSLEQSRLTLLAADILTGYYKRKRLTQEEVAERSGIPLTTVQKKLRGKSPINASELVVLSRAIGVDPVQVMAEIVKEADASDDTVSAPVVTIESRRPKTPAEMTDDELESQRSAATFDSELEQDETEAP